MNKDEIRLMQNAAAVVEKQNAQISQLKASQRRDRLRKSETEVKNAAKPKTREGRVVALKLAEADIARQDPKDPRLVFAGMTQVKPKPAEPVAKAGLVRAYRNAVDAARR